MLSLSCIKFVATYVAFPQAELCVFEVIKLDVQIRPVLQTRSLLWVNKLSEIDVV